jgi:hypothetical protein
VVKRGKAIEQFEAMGMRVVLVIVDGELGYLTEDLIY